MMTITGVSDNVQALLEATDKFTNVFPHEPTDETKFTGYPSAAHYYMNTESSYATVSQNRRILEYIVELYMQVDAATTEADRYKEAYTLIDSIVQTFDESIDLSSDTIPLAKACDIMRPAPGELQQIKLDDGIGFVATIRLFCESDITFRNT